MYPPPKGRYSTSWGADPQVLDQYLAALVSKSYRATAFPPLPHTAM
jgi:hypothetical protein